MDRLDSPVLLACIFLFVSVFTYLVVDWVVAASPPSPQKQPNAPATSVEYRDFTKPPAGVPYDKYIGVQLQGKDGNWECNFVKEKK